jgi:hypothetical protein
MVNGVVYVVVNCPVAIVIVAAVIPFFLIAKITLASALVTILATTELTDRL